MIKRKKGEIIYAAETREEFKRLNNWLKYYENSYERTGREIYSLRHLETIADIRELEEWSGILRTGEFKSVYEDRMKVEKLERQRIKGDEDAKKFRKEIEDQRDLEIQNTEKELNKIESKVYMHRDFPPPKENK